MRVFTKFIVVMVIAALLSPSYALVRGNDVYPKCVHMLDEPNPSDFKDKKSIIEISMKRGLLIGFCTAVIGTSFQAIRGVGYIWSVDGDFARCMEDYYGLADIDGNQILDMTMKYLKNHPEYRDIEINIVMASMLRDYYPASVCLKNKK